MAEYRLYCLNEHGHFSKVYEMTADSDQEAVANARELKVIVDCELWSGDHLVATLPARPIWGRAAASASARSSMVHRLPQGDRPA